MVRVDTASDYEEHFSIFYTFTSQVKVLVKLIIGFVTLVHMQRKAKKINL